VKTVIVDDEPLARRRLRRLLREQPAVEVVAECGDGLSAVEAVRIHQPELLFLDIEMPELGGFEVLERLTGDHVPAVVFVTAYNEHAVRAFEVNAMDYLLKPFHEERFRQCLARVRSRIPSAAPEGELQGLRSVLADLKAAQSGRLVVRNGPRTTLLRISEIDWVEAEGNYLVVHAGPDRHILRSALADLATKLPAAQFARIHRSTVVNLERIKEVESVAQGEYIVVLRDGTRLPSGRSYRASLEALLGVG